MPVRTTPEAVSKIIEVDISTRALADVLEPFIETASQVVTDVCGGSDYTDEKFELIERWLAAHFYGVFDTQLQGETAGPVTATYFWKTGFILHQTRYGQQAMMIDTDGSLARLNKQLLDGTAGRTTSFTWGGTEYD